MSPGTRWAYVGNGLGIGASIALNASEASSRNHGTGPVIVAGSVPVFLYVALEILARKRITGWKRWITYPGFMTVVSVTFLTSYQDQVAILQRWGFEPLSAAIFPVGIDGLMIVAAVALLEGDAILANPEPQVETETFEEVEQSTISPEANVTSIAADRAKPQPRPRRADTLREEWLSRQGTDNEMTAAEIDRREGKGIHSARSKLNRWKKAQNDARAMEFGGSAAIRGGIDGAAEPGDLDVRPVVADDEAPSGFQDLAPEMVAG